MRNGHLPPMQIQGDVTSGGVCHLDGRSNNRPHRLDW